MIVGLDGLTLFHIAISLVGIAAGFVMVGGFLANTSLANATHMFLWTNVATSATGFLFPFSKLLPSHIVGIISLVILAIAVYAYYVAEPTAFWRKIFVSFSTAALYLNIFVLAAQTFAKNPALAALAPTQSELPFVATQGAILIAFLIIGYVSVKRFSTPQA